MPHEPVGHEGPLEPVAPRVVLGVDEGLVEIVLDLGRRSQHRQVPETLVAIHQIRDGRGIVQSQRPDVHTGKVPMIGCGGGRLSGEDTFDQPGKYLTDGRVDLDRGLLIGLGGPLIDDHDRK